VVPGEHLVGALAGLHDLHVAGHLLGQQVERHHVVAHHRLAHGGNGAGQRLEHIGRGDVDRVVLGAETVGHDPGEAELVALLAAEGLEADAERGQTALSGLGQHADDQARVEPAGQQHTDRHVGHHAPIDRQPQGPFDGLDPFLPAPLGRRVCAARGGVPVDRLLPAAVGFEHQHRGRCQLPHAPQQGAGAGHDGVEREVVVQRHRIDLRVDASPGEQPRHGRREAQGPGDLGVVERFDAQPVAAQHGPAAVPLHDAEREHTDEFVDEAGAPVVVCLQHHLAVAGGEEAVAGRFQLGAQ
jgi:hypothetical protein